MLGRRVTCKAKGVLKAKRFSPTGRAHLTNWPTVMENNGRVQFDKARRWTGPPLIGMASSVPLRIGS